MSIHRRAHRHTRIHMLIYKLHTRIPEAGIEPGSWRSAALRVTTRPLCCHEKSHIVIKAKALYVGPFQNIMFYFFCKESISWMWFHAYFLRHELFSCHKKVDQFSIRSLWLLNLKNHIASIHYDSIPSKNSHSYRIKSVSVGVHHRCWDGRLSLALPLQCIPIKGILSLSQTHLIQLQC